jgi:hypothetical protein
MIFKLLKTAKIKKSHINGLQSSSKNISKLKQILLNNYIEHMHKELCVPK